MARIIPGVQVTVIKEVVPPQLAPSGVLGLVGLVAPARNGTQRKQVERVGSWARFRELYGRASALAMPEAQHALQNGVFELVVVAVDSSVATAASASFSYDTITTWLTFSARAKGTAMNDLELVMTPQYFQGKLQGHELRVRDGNQDLEVHRNLSLFPGEARYIGTVLDETDSIIQLDGAPALTVATLAAPVTLAAANDAVVLATTGTGTTAPVLEVELNAATATNGVTISRSGDTITITRATWQPADAITIAADAPDFITQVRDALDGETDITVTMAEISGTKTLSSGVDASVDDYGNALGLLADVPDVDLVVASVQELSVARAAAIYQQVIAHCDLMSADAKGRIGFGHVPPSGNSAIDEHLDLVGSLRSDRFVMLAPHGVLGAVVGRVGSLPYYHSPTFKSLSGLGVLDTALRVEEQRSYLRESIVPVAEVPGRGNAIVRGLTTDGDQINVRRIADRAVRGVKQIGELFIGKLNTETGRNALKQKLNEFLLQMQAENAIVPSTDGSDPAFKLAVYSSQADFAQGIVRVDLAVRPVRAIDYIYATVLVQV